MTTTMVDLRGRFTLTVEEGGQLRGLGRGAAYRATETGDLPCLKAGNRKVIPTVPLLQSLGWSEAMIATALGIDSNADAAPQLLRPVHDGALDTETNSDAGVVSAGVGNVRPISQGVRHGQSSSAPPT